MRYWQQNLVACANGGDNSSKGAVAALDMTLFRSLSSRKQQLVDRTVNSGELILDPSHLSAPPNQGDVIKVIIATVAKNYATDTIRRMVALHKQEYACTGSGTETIYAFVERFVGTAKAYINIANGDRESTESQNFAILLVCSARVPASTFTTIMNNSMQTTEAKSSFAAYIFPMSAERVDRIISIPKDIKDGK